APEHGGTPGSTLPSAGSPNRQDCGSVHGGFVREDADDIGASLNLAVLDLPRFHGRVRIWVHGSGCRDTLSSCWQSFFSSAPTEPFFGPGPPGGAAVARSSGQGRPHLPGRPKGLSLTAASTAAG